MRNTLELSADKLRVQAILVCSASLLCASALPVVSYVYVYQHANSELGPFAWTHWAIVGATCLLGVLAHSLNNKVLLALHAASSGMLGAALGGFDTAFWYQLWNRCQTAQLAFLGCQQCPCATTNTCTATNFQNDVLCQSCAAYSAEACDPALQVAQKFVIAFTGLAAVIFLALPTFYSLLVLCRVEASAAVAAARRQMVSFAVDQQTAMVESNEKPFVTPAMLAAWVTFLLGTGDADSVAIGERCCSVLSARGFELDVAKPKPSKKKDSKAKKDMAGKKRGGSANEITADSSSAGAPPNAEAYAAAESGASGSAHRPVRVNSDRRVQFVVQK